MSPLALLTVAYPLLHKLVSDVFDWASGRLGFEAYQRATLIGIPLLCALAALPFIGGRWSALLYPRRLSALFALVALTVASQQWLMVVNVELIHLPQFALIAVAAVALGFGTQVAFFAATASGIIDETWQYFVIYAGRSDTYFDINDIVLNALGAAWGIVLLTRPHEDQPSRGRHLPWRVTAACLLAAAGLAWMFDPPVLDPLVKMTPASQKLYRVLSAPEGVAWCAILWGIVALARLPESAPAKRLRPTPAGTASLLLIALGLQGCARSSAIAVGGPPAHSSTPVATAAGSPFITTFWCGPPLDEFTDMRAQEIADAGFTLVGSPCEGEIDPTRNRRALDVAARHGLKMLVADGRFSKHATRQPEWETLARQGAAEYRDHQAFGGYFVDDEPTAPAFDGLARIVGVLQDGNQDLAYINLLPDYFPNEIGTPTYGEYVERFILSVRPRLLSYDHYPFRTSGDRPSFFANLSQVREAALRHNLPFMLIVLAMPHLDYRDPTEAELSWQAFHALAFGARGLSYFAYWTPVNVPFADRMRFRHGLIEGGLPTRHFHEAQRVNAMVRAAARELERFRSVAVADSLAQVAGPLPPGPLTGIAGGSITVGLFEDDRGQRAALLVNRDYRRDASITLRMREGAPAAEQFDFNEARWRAGSDRPQIPAGKAALFRWPAASR